MKNFEKMRKKLNKDNPTIPIRNENMKNPNCEKCKKEMKIGGDDATRFFYCECLKQKLSDPTTILQAAKLANEDQKKVFYGEETKNLHQKISEYLETISNNGFINWKTDEVKKEVLAYGEKVRKEIEDDAPSLKEILEHGRRKAKNERKKIAKENIERLENEKEKCMHEYKSCGRTSGCLLTTTRNATKQQEIDYWTKFLEK